MRRSVARGLSQLLVEPAESPTRDVEIEAIEPNPRQPRRHFDEAGLSELAQSIAEVGVLQPLVVRKLGPGRYELIAGERRLRAAKMAGLRRVPVVVRTADHQATLELALIENLQREDIGPLECARAYKRLMEEFDLSQDKVAERVGKSRSAVANTLRLLRLPSRVQEGLEKGLITEGHARALLAVENEGVQLALYERILAKGLSVRDTEQATRKAGPKKASGPRSRGEPDPHWSAVREAISELLGSPVKVERSGQGGKLVIPFYSEDDLDRILSALGVEL